MDSTENPNKNRIFASIIGCAIFIALLVFGIVLQMTTFAPPAVPPPGAPSIVNDRSALHAALSTNAVQDRYFEVAALGSRAPGQEGLTAAHDMIRAAFEKAGLEVYDQDVPLVTPSLKEGSGYISNATSRITVWPCLPNYAQTVTTGASGIDGELFLATSESIQSGIDFSDKIAVIDSDSDLFKEYEYKAARYVDLGFKAVIYTCSSGLTNAPWGGIFTQQFYMKDFPVNLIRVAAEKEVLDHIGEKFHMEVRSLWSKKNTYNIIGVMRAGNAKTSEALVIPVEYDATSFLPDLANGSLEALQTAVLLQTIEAFKPYSAQFQRDVIFVAATGISQSQYGLNRLVATIGPSGKRDNARALIENNIKTNEKRIQQFQTILKLFDDPEFATPGSTRKTHAAIQMLPHETKKLFESIYSASVRYSVFVQSDRLLKADIAYHRRPDDLSSPEYHIYRAQKKYYDDLNNLSALPLPRALERSNAAGAKFYKRNGSLGTLREVAKDSFEYFLAYHKERAASYEKDAKLQKLFARYDNFITVAPRLFPKSPEVDRVTDRISINGGQDVNLRGNYSTFITLMNKTIYDNGMYEDIEKIFYGPWNGLRDYFSTYLTSNPFGMASFPSFTFATIDYKPKPSEYPFRQTEFNTLNPLRRPLFIFAETTLNIALGHCTFEKLSHHWPRFMQGNVFISGIGNSVVPNYPVAGALVCSCDKKPYMFTDPYGHYEYPYMFTPAYEGWYQYDTFLFNENGEITYTKDYGTSAQNIFKTGSLDTKNLPQNHILYRSTPVVLLNCINPQTLKAFSGFSFINASGLSDFTSTCKRSSEHGFMDFLPPGARFFLTLKDGSPDNELVATTRAFCLGTSDTNNPAYKPSENEIDGPGYLACDTPIFKNMPSEAAGSMMWLADKRLSLQEQYSMADDLTLAFSEKSRAVIDYDTNNPRRSALTRLQDLRNGLSYQILNHPVIRGTISESVAGIIWYLGLLVPFVFFFEKLVFGFTDIRKQIAAEGIFFLIIFAILRILHPAFHMIRSSAMILLGFIIMLVVGSVTLVLSGKFKENLDEMRKAQGGVKGASGNKLGIILTAFMLGLNNMHRRKVRTGLTCATLVLMTFVMICFTSVQSDVVESERAIGSSSYQGVVIRKKEFRPIAASEIDAIRSQFRGHEVNRRSITPGWLDWNSMMVVPPNLPIYLGEGDNARTVRAQGIVFFDSTEPMSKQFPLLCTNGWFTANQQQHPEEYYPIIISDTFAEQLGITQEDVEKGRNKAIDLWMNGHGYYVHNIFESHKMRDITDINGEDFMPYDCLMMLTPRFLRGSGDIIADDTIPHLDPADVVFCLNGQYNGGMRCVSLAVDLGKSPYATARKEISTYLEQTGSECHYAIDGTAFIGRRARSRSMAGLIDLIIPLIIAALTVLNTMKGSVYERSNEIYVYNAVGIAPRYIFFMFVAEALVYSVVGALLGYILSQGIGRVLMTYHLTGGINMNFTSISTIYASLAIAAATLLSTWFPARKAMEIAKPADNAGWSLPPPDEKDNLSILLPFTFTHRDRIAVLAFFHDFFDSFGEGGAGSFFASEPELRIADHTDPLANDAYIPALTVNVWLKPFDLGVSQAVTIELGTDPETREFIAKMIVSRLTGTRDAWLRLNTTFVTAIRRHFLHWRAVPDSDKEPLFKRATAMLHERYADA